MATRKSVAGGAVKTTISSGAFNVGATACTLTSVTGWPTTVSGPFVAVIDRGAATEEKILVVARAATALSSISRGYDGTSEVNHGANATIEHCVDSILLDEANRLSSLLTTKGDSLGHDGTQTQREGVGTAGYYYTATPAAATGKAWTAPPSALATAKGDSLIATGSGVLVRQPAPADNQVLVGDSTQVNGVRSVQGPVIVCTSATRPSVPTAGMTTCETDTYRTLQYTTATTGWRQPWNMPWGVIATTSDVTPRGSSINSAAGLVVFPTLNFTPLTGRWYKVSWQSARVDNGSAPGGLVVTLTDQAGTVQANLATYFWWAGNPQWIPMSSFVLSTWATGSLTGFQVRGQSTGTAAVTFQAGTYAGYLSVEDVGPSANPA